MAAFVLVTHAATAVSFTSRVDAAVATTFGADHTARVREAWARMARGEELQRVLEEGHPQMVQQATSFVDGLTPRCFYDDCAKKFKWLHKMEKAWPVISRELCERLADEAGLEARGNNIWGGLQNESIKEAYGPEWRTLPLCDRTVWDDANAALFPRTCEAIHRAKVPLLEAFFAKMPAGATIKPHSDMCNFALTAHLGVDVPPGGLCSLTVGRETRRWENGKTLLFDTSILHSAENRADATRYVLMMRVYHPELTATERQALQLIFDCLDEPELLDDAEALREYTQRRRALEAESRRPWESALLRAGAKR